MLKLHEGLRLVAYEDTTGHATLGFGHNLETPITFAAAENILDDDVARATFDLRARFPWTSTLDEVRHAVLVDMVFNLGIGGFAQFKTTLGLVKDGDYSEASRQMLKSKWAGQVGLRAERLSYMMRTGEWPSA